MHWHGLRGGGALHIKRALEEELARYGLPDEVAIVPTGCNGFCGQGPLLVVLPDQILYGPLETDDIPFLVQSIS